MMLILTITLIGNNLLKKYNAKYINDALLGTIVGLITGLLIKAFGGINFLNNISDGYVKFFIIILLPPIIFER